MIVDQVDQKVKQLVAQVMKSVYDNPSSPNLITYVVCYKISHLLAQITRYDYKLCFF